MMSDLDKISYWEQRHSEASKDRDTLKAQVSTLQNSLYSAEAQLVKFSGKTQSCSMCEDWARKAERLANILDDIRYCFKNMWAWDRKKFEAEFMPKIEAALKSYRDMGGKRD